MSNKKSLSEEYYAELLVYCNTSLWPSFSEFSKWFKPYYMDALDKLSEA